MAEKLFLNSSEFEKLATDDLCVTVYQYNTQTITFFELYCSCYFINADKLLNRSATFVDYQIEKL